jgi:hypothetical protein
VTRPSPNPLAGVDRLLVDGNNLLHSLRHRGAGPGEGARPPLPAAALVGRLRAAVPAQVAIELVFDGPPDPGMRGTRVASGLIVRHAGRRSADQLLLALVEEARAVAGPSGADNILVVTDDRDLRIALTTRGARTARSHWLLGRLERRTLEAPATGNARPAGAGRAAARDAANGKADPDDAERAGWRPGRGATMKRGNPRRRRRRPPIHG